jgi:hypothetical protein
MYRFISQNGAYLYCKPPNISPYIWVLNHTGVVNHTEALNLIETGQCLFYFLQMCYNITFGGNFITQTSAPRRVDNGNVPQKDMGMFPQQGIHIAWMGKCLYIYYIYIYIHIIKIYVYTYIYMYIYIYIYIIYVHR